MKIYTHKERMQLWNDDQVLFAELAHQYPCCDIPTEVNCKTCKITCENKGGRKMKMTDFEMDVEIPVRVFCSFHRADPSSGFYQGHPAYTRIDEIRLPDDVAGYIENKYREEILKAAEENME